MSTSWFGPQKPKNPASNLINTPAWLTTGPTVKSVGKPVPKPTPPAQTSDERRQPNPTLGTPNSDPPATTNVYRSSSLKESDLDYNVGMVLPAYHGNRFEALTQQKSDIPNKIGGLDLKNQFSVVGQNKGMIVTYVPSDGSEVTRAIPNRDGVVSSTVRVGRYGFQFHYNPKSLSMSYASTSDVDLGYIASGEDPFHLAGAATTQSAISIQIPLNRIADFQYYNPKTNELKAGSQGIYGPNTPSAAHQQRIYEFGTMYDIEYLLASCLGYKMQTAYRDMTSDIGYVAGSPVDVLLGKKLRYRAMVTRVDVGHEIFDQRMVPIFSTVSISLSIMPDIQGFV